jgi:hypothetical protein
MAEPKPKDEQQQDEKTAFEKFEDLTRKLLKVPKEELDEKREQEREKKRAG